MVFEPLFVILVFLRDPGKSAIMIYLEVKLIAVHMS